MGKSKGGKYHHAPKPKVVRKAPGEESEEESEEEQKFVQRNRGLGGQRANVGMLPPSDSEEEEESGDEAGDSKPKEPAPKPAAKPAPKKKDESDSEEDDSDSDSSDSSDGVPMNEYLTAPRQKKVVQTEERDPETIRKDLERLELIRKKREDDRKKRIAEEGWDRFAPISDTNRPPGYVPSDHPTHGKEK